MPTPFSSQDLGRVFDQPSLTRGRTLVLTGGVTVTLDGEVIAATVEAPTGRFAVTVTPLPAGRRTNFERRCSCGAQACAHQAAALFAALERFPSLRRVEQQSFLDKLADTPVRYRPVFDLAEADPPFACHVEPKLLGERTDTLSVSARQIAGDEAMPAWARAIAASLGSTNATSIPLEPAALPGLLTSLLRSGAGRWGATGRTLVAGSVMTLPVGITAPPPPILVLLGAEGAHYVNPETGVSGRLRLREAAAPERPAPPPPAHRPAVPAGRVASGRRRGGAAASDHLIVEQPPTPVLRLTRFRAPDEQGRVGPIDAMLLEFDYDGVLVAIDDDKQFVRRETRAGPTFLRRDRTTESASLEALKPDRFMQMRMAIPGNARGRLAFVFRGREANEDWQRFIAERLPALTRQGWRSIVEPEFGPRMAEQVGAMDMRISDAPTAGRHGGFALDLGVEVDGTRHPLLPILLRLREKGGLTQAQRDEGEVVASLEDGRIIRLPVARIDRLLGVLEDLIEAARRTGSNELVLDAAEAPAVLDLETLVTARWQDGAAIAAHVARFRPAGDIPPAHVSARFHGTLRPYQHEGLSWLQHLRSNGVGGLLADDMGLGKTAQTIAHIAAEAEAGRLDHPCLVVVPTSLVANWTAELARFAPSLRVLVLHGLDRHGKRAELDRTDVAITTYSVLVRDIEEMAALSWHLVVLDEAQAIKSATAKATLAVCRLETRHRLCLSGTPIENNLGELWSQFAFLVPGLLGQKRTFTKRFRTPIEKGGDVTRRQMLAQRIRPFILRRTKAAVASDLPPKHTILRRITLADDQRELYETIRATLHEEVAAEIAAHGLGRSQVVVLDALLKLRQVCCDPRLVKLPRARLTESSSKLEDLLEMLTEMAAEGRRVLLFSQFTSMLDLIKPRLKTAGIDYVELRGDTRDRATPVDRFQTGTVPVFLISLKAGGRGLNLTAADTVIHYDPWWNPAAEDQASDRAHRIGQTKSVFVYKLIAMDTVEERILALQERKAALASIAFGEDAAAIGALEAGDIEFLFGGDPSRLAA